MSSYQNARCSSRVDLTVHSRDVPNAGDRQRADLPVKLITQNVAQESLFEPRPIGFTVSQFEQRPGSGGERAIQNNRIDFVPPCLVNPRLRSHSSRSRSVGDWSGWFKLNLPFLSDSSILELRVPPQEVPEFWTWCILIPRTSPRQNADDTRKCSCVGVREALRASSGQELA